MSASTRDVIPHAVLSAASRIGTGTPAELIGGASTTATIAASRAAGAHAFVVELAEGYDTPVGAGGVNLSAAQHLRLAVARMLADDPPVVVLDDPTAGLDAADEAAVLPGLEMLLRGRQVTLVGGTSAVRRAVARATGASSGAAHVTTPGRCPAPSDVALPALSRLLDPQHMSPLLGGMLEQDSCDVRVESVRYKPGENVVVQYAALTPSGWRTAVAYARAGSGLDRKRKKQPNRTLAHRAADRSPARKPFGFLPEVSALVQWLPLDVRLPILSDSAERLAGRLAKKGIVVAADVEEPELLRYWPRRRAVLRFGPFILKVYRERSDFDEARRGLRASKKLRAVCTSRYVGGLTAQKVTVQQWLPGRAVSLQPSSSVAAGAVAAALHGDRRLALPSTTPEDVLAKAAVRGDFVGQLQPGLRSEIATLLGDLAARIPRGARLMTSHGNLHAGQFLAAGSGLALIDVDRMCRAAPAYDLASFAAHSVFGRPGDADVLGTVVASVIDGYGARPEGLEWYLAACLLRRTAVPFRFQDEHWPQAASELVALAREALG